MKIALPAVTKPAFKRQGVNQAGWMWLPRLHVKQLLIRRTRKVWTFEAPMRTVLITTPSTLAITSLQCHKGSKGVWGLAPIKFYNYIPYNAGDCPSFANIIGKLQSIIFDIEKTITGYQMIKIQRYGRARAGKIVELGALPPLATPWLSGWLPA